MATVLDQIVAAKRAAVRQRERSVPLERLRRDLVPSRRSLVRALRRDACGLILECKQRAPSAGQLCSGRYDPVRIARQYQEVASAISVLTDEPFFGGHLSHLEQVSHAVSLPVLCKDFVVDPYQLYEARRHGADAILLMASVLEQADLIRCLHVAGKLTMDALVEVRDEEELSRALDAGATLVGINNRDLDTLQVNLETTERLAPRIPRSITLVSESGIRDHRDLRRLSPLVDGLLVGSAMMRHPSPERAARQLAFGRIKICGLTRKRDARQAWQLGATWGGLILAPQSSRALSQDRAAALRRSCPELRWTGVFVNESPRGVVRAARALQLDAVQLHGEEPPDHVAAISERLPAGCEVWKACRVQDCLPRVEQTDARRILLDTHSRKRRGGTGSTFDWSLLDGAALAERRRFILAGGIGPENVAAADARELWALDVNSKVEDAPGKKSGPKLKQLFCALRQERRTDDQRQGTSRTSRTSRISRI